MDFVSSPKHRGPHAVLHISQHPWTFVRATECYRSAQIICRLFSARFPGQQFNVMEGFAPGYGLCTPAYRDSAQSVEINTIVGAELASEAEDNPDRLPKWIAFHFNDPDAFVSFQYCGYLEHDTEVVEKCRADESLVAEGPIFSVYPEEHDILAINPKLLPEGV